MRYLRILLAGLLILPYPADPQTSTSNAPPPQTTFRSNVRRVLVDVVVTNGKDEPVTGLPKDTFHVFEDGHAQTLTTFDEHSGLPDVPALARQAKLPPNFFSNLPVARTGDAANVLLLDALNTQMQDQSNLHAQMIKYVKGLRPGTRLAIFALGARLRFVQGFTGDPQLLMAALDGKKSAGNPQLSPLFETAAEADANERTVDQMKELQASLPNSSTALAASIGALEQFQAETVSFQTDSRIRTTLDAMQQLAGYLEGIPGRKNVIWFSGSFPLAILSGGSGSPTDSNGNPTSVLPDALPNPDAVTRQYQGDIIRTANLLSAAQIAIYPIGAQGLAVDPQFDFSGPQGPHTIGLQYEQQATQTQIASLQGAATGRNAGFAAMDELARDTGGEALYNTNGLNEALDHVVTHGTHYYTLAYSPTNHNMDGTLRRIEVKVDGNYHLSYRRGYYATDVTLAHGAKSNPAGDPLRPLMDHGTPDATAIAYTMRVIPAARQPAPGTAWAGDNEDLKGPVTRYTVTFLVSSDRLQFDAATDGIHRGNLEVALLGYDRDGQLVNWMVRVLQIRLAPERYSAVEASGLPFSLDIDLPSSSVYLRTGIYDQGSSEAGTLEIPLAALAATAGAPK